LNDILYELASGDRARLPVIIYKVKDIWPGKARTNLLKFFFEHRASDLNITSRGLLLHALQQLKISAHFKCQDYVKKIFLDTTEGDLTRLKLVADSKGNYHSLHKLVFTDIKDQGVRAQILEHIRKQSMVLSAHMRMAGKIGRRLYSQRPWRKILSDVDDTLLCSGGHFPAGSDKSIPRKEIYPGVLSLYRELDLGATTVREWSPPASGAEEANMEMYLKRDVGNLVFLSARPHIYADWTEQTSYRKFAELVRQRRLYTMPTLLPGDLATGSEFVMYQNYEPLARRKFPQLSAVLTTLPRIPPRFHRRQRSGGRARGRAHARIRRRCGKLGDEGRRRVHPPHPTYPQDVWAGEP